MERDTRTLLVAGAVLLVSAAGWSRFRGAEEPASRLLAGAAHTGRPTVSILFTPQDCGTLIESLRLWNAPYEARRVAVRGLLQLPRGRSEEMRKIVRGAPLRFPVQAVSASQASDLRESIGYRGESLIILADSAGRVRHIIPLDSVATPGARADALELAESLGSP